MRKIFALTIALMLSVGAVFADEIKAVFVKYADGKITAKVDDKEKTFVVDTDAKMKTKGKDGAEKEVSIVDYITNEKRGLKDGDKVTLTVEKDKVVKVARERGEKGKKTDK
jgi:hypothetical protein